MQKETRQGQHKSQLGELKIHADCLPVRRSPTNLWKLREAGRNLQFFFE